MFNFLNIGRHKGTGISQSRLEIGFQRILDRLFHGASAISISQALSPAFFDKKSSISASV
jgi:hypothetical protein